MDIISILSANTGTAGALIMLLLGIYVPSAYNRSRAARAAYRLAFDDALLNLRENPDCPLAQITFGCHPQHLAAIDKFRASVPRWRRDRFERDVAYYKKANNIASDHGSVFALALSEKSDIARAKRTHYSEAIQRLLAHA